jgi:tight adherence protein B
VVTLRTLAAAGLGLAAILLAAHPAYADSDLPVSVADVRPGQVRLVAALPTGADGRIPQVTVSRDGYALPAGVAPGVKSGAPPRTLTIVVGARMDAATLRAAREAVAAFAGGVPGDVTLGLVGATDPPTVVVRPTRDRAAFRAGLDGLRTTAGEDLPAALRTAAAAAPDGGERRLLLVAAPAAAGGTVPLVGQRVDVVTIGPVGGLAELASASGGGSYPATADTLAATLRTAARLPALFTITVSVPRELSGAAASLRVSAGTGTARSSADVQVRFADATGGGSDSDSDADSGSPLDALRPGMLGVLFFVVLLLALLLVIFGGNGTRRQRRIEQVQRFRLAGRGSNVSGAAAMPQPGVAARVARAAGDDQRVAKRLDDAGMAMRPAQWRTIQVGAAVAGGIVLGLLLGLLGALLGVLLGALLTMAYPRLRERHRRAAFADQLPDALQLVVGSLRSGFSLTQALDAVVRDAPPGPLAAELGRAMGEVRLGGELADALDRAAVRADNQDLAWAVIAIRIQHETGGNLAETLETTVDTIRERGRLRRHVRALSAEGRLSAYLLLGLPIAIAGWMFLVSREYLSVLWTTPTGLILLVGAGLLMVLGAFWMSRWLKVEV